MKAIKILSLLAAITLGISASAQRKIQVAVLLDNSGSMQGLINQAKSQLWNIVNEMATAKADGQSAHIEIALYEYGETPKQILPLTTDLDKISEALFALSIRGGDEFCGATIDKSLGELDWSHSNKDLKMIYICGNEPFNQGNIDYKTACKEAISKGIIVNTIFCGNNSEGINSLWKDGADIGEGKYFNIDQNQAIAYVSTPYDNKLSELNQKLNATYIGYGAAGNAMKANQKMQDVNAGSLSPAVAAERTVAKSSSAYKADDWDLVDAIKNKKVDVSEIDEADLPEDLKNKSEAEILKTVETNAKERAEIQEEIQNLNKDRQKYIETEQKKSTTGNTLDEAMKKSMRENAAKNGFSF